MIGSIAMDREPTAKMEKELFKDWGNEATAPKPDLKKLQNRLAVLQSKANVAESLVDFQPVGNKRARNKLAALQTQIKELNEEIRSAKQLI